MSWVGVATSRLFKGVFAHRWLFGVPIATCVFLATLHAVRLPDQYTASAVLEIKNLSLDGGAELPTERSRSVESIAETTRDRLLSHTPMASIVTILYPTSTKRIEEQVDDARGKIEYERVTDFSLKVALTDLYPERAQMALDRLITTFLEQERLEPLRTAQRNVQFYEERVATYDAKRKAAYDALDAYRRTHNDTLPEQQGSITMEIQQGTNDLANERSQRTRASGRLEKLQADLADYAAPRAGLVQRKKTVQEQMAEDALAKARKRVEKAETAFNAIRARFTPRAKEYVAAKSDLDSAERDEAQQAAELRQATQRADGAWDADRAAFIKKQVRDLEYLKTQAAAELTQADARIAEIRTRMGEAQERLRRIPATREGLDKRQREVTDWEKRHDEARRLADRHAKLAAYYRDTPPAEATRFRLAQPVTLPFKPSGPSRMRWILTGLLVGGLIGYAGLLLRKRYDVAATLDVSDLQRLLPGALVVSVPRLGPGARARPTVSIREVLLGTWVLGCVVLTCLAYGAYKGWLAAPEWLTGVMDPALLGPFS
ncbi:MAG: hypothetical protein QNJ98_12085 [Planctomycetota bacterium]|nr:hypothetical protein [Planctomycetota bacterium]